MPRKSEKMSFITVIKVVSEQSPWTSFLFKALGSAPFRDRGMDFFLKRMLQIIKIDDYRTMRKTTTQLFQLRIVLKCPTILKKNRNPIIYRLGKKLVGFVSR